MPRLNTNRGIWKAIVGLLLLLAAAKPGTAWAQAEASINGTVADTTGAVISGATVRVKNLEIGTARIVVDEQRGAIRRTIAGGWKIRNIRRATGISYRSENRNHARDRPAPQR